MSKKAILLAGVSAFFMSQTAHAQLDEVIVTATKRAESLQDVPVSVVATSGETINDLGLTDARDVSDFMPAVTITENPIGNFVFIRGIGSAGANQGIEQSVSIFHDGIYMGRHQLSRAPFMDLERVEVLKGPQSILFGKNTIGGAIHAIAARPTNESEASIRALVGEHGEAELAGVVSGAIGDNTRARLSLRGYNMDGYLENVMTGNDGPRRRDFTFRAQLEHDFSDTFTVRGKYERSTFNTQQQSTQLVITNPFDAGAAGVSGLNQALVATATGGTGVEALDLERAVDNDGGALVGQVAPVFAGLPGFPDKPEISNNEMDVASITIDWDIGDHTLTAVSGYAGYDYRDICDCDFAALPLIQVDATEDYEQYSQEIRLTSPVGNVLDYIVGAYYQKSDLEYRSIEGFGSALAFQQVGVPTPLLVPNLTRDYSMSQDQEMWAVFGSATWNMSDRTRFTGGLRYFDESKTADHKLDKLFTGGWDYSALLGAPAGTVAFGDTAADYDAFLAGFGQVDLGGITAGFLTEAVYGGLLGTFEHDIRDRKRSEDAVTWSVTAEHDFNSNVLGYATVSTGVKGGGFDARFLRGTNDPFFEYEEETAISYEAGVKSTLLDGTMRFNAAAFFSTVEDYQVSIFDGATAFFVQNAAEVETKGVEVDLTWAATDQLTLGFAGSFLDATYSDFPNAPCWAGSATENRGDCVGRGTPTAFRDATGDANQFSPEFSLNARADYVQPLGENLEGRAQVNLAYSDGYAISGDLDELYGFQPSYTRIDARIALGNIDDEWELAVIGKNLTDENVSGNSNDQPLVNGNGFSLTSRPRSFAVQASYKFR